MKVNWLSFALIAALLYFSVASVAFQARNPKANHVQVFMHFDNVLTFKRMAEFQ
jgi:hypothetical protein